MNFHLTDEQQRVADKADAFADEFLEPIAADLDRSGKYPKAIIAELGKQGLLALIVSNSGGGRGAGFTAHVEALRRISQTCPAVGSIVNNHAIATHTIGKWGSPSQRTNHLAALAKGESLAALCVYESGPGFGLGPHALLGTEAGGKITLNGKKQFVRNAGVADYYVVFATFPAYGEKTNISAFIVDAKIPGLSVGAAAQTMGLRGCPVADITFENVILDDFARLGAAREGTAILDETLSAYAVGEAAQTVGIGKAAAKHAAAAAKHRIQFGHPIFALQPIQTLLAEIASDAHLAWLGVQHAAQLIEEGLPFGTEAAIVKIFLGRFGAKMLIDAIQVEGGLGICETAPPHFNGTLPLARLFRDLAGTTLLETPADYPEALIAASL
jgi:alkylation response protein AidB-like acyl-CoA dehydrogenase